MFPNFGYWLILISFVRVTPNQRSHTALSGPVIIIDQNILAQSTCIDVLVRDRG